MTTALTSETEDDLRRGLAAACRAAGIDHASAQLIKYTMNAVFAIGPYIARLARGGLAAERAARVTRAAEALEDVGVPTIRLAHDVADQPVHANEWVATFWQRVTTTDVEPKPVDLAAPLRAIHAVDRLSVELPTWSQLDKCRRRLAAVDLLPADDAAATRRWALAELDVDLAALMRLLRARCDEIEASLQHVQWHSPWGVIHADAHTGNALLTGRPRRPEPDPGTVLCDLDGLCHGPREWDLVPVAHGPARFGRSQADYRSFVDAYGFDVTTWPGWPVLRELRELQLVTSVIDGIAGRPEVARQLGHRLRSLIAEDRHAVWDRYR